VLDRHAQSRVVSDGGLQERHGRSLALVLVHLHEVRARVIFDGHMSGLPASVSRGISAIACHAVAGLRDAPELLGVDVQQLARRLSFEANDWCNGIECLQAGQLQSCNALDKQLATFQCQSGIPMAVHLVGFLCDSEVW
tara:strand:- start:505 stop:921 length:417 start_codon:yes stop_codon:yes gene_type:complete